MNIDKLLSDLLRVEGGYVNDPRDAGGETNWGITAKTARANGYNGDMREMKREDALAIYRNQYFYKPGYGKVMEVSPAIAAELFDTGVNMGPSVASTFLQRSLNVLNDQQKHYADLKVDGQIGQKTLEALKALVKRRGLENTETVLLRALNCLQGARYIELAEKREANEAFVYGWLMNRVSLS